ncbi:hypothetical protein JNO04_12285 [Halomonas sp. MC140]|nr:hypothetical protein [Halomonas sp. MC140]MDN7133120.1 hypothetical protein [Halomonas sp. MC140]
MIKKLLEADEKRILYVQGFLFFYPTHQLCVLLNAPTALKHGYEEAWKPGWLTWRTFVKFLNPSNVKGIRPTTQAKMERIVADKPELELLRFNSQELDFLWEPYNVWSALIASKCLHEIVSKEYWQSRVDAERDLIKELLDTVGAHNKLRVLLACNLASKPGCLLARHDVEKLLFIDPPSGSFEAYPELIRFRLCAFSSMLLRFAAWLAAEWEYLTDSYKVRVPLETFLPRFCPKVGAWSNPVSSFLDYIAANSGCPPDSTTSAFLGKLWAEQEYLKDDEGIGRGEDIASKQKLLRNWIGKDSGRPEHSSIKGFTEAVAYRQALPSDHAFDVIAIGYAKAFIFLETCREFRAFLSIHKLPNSMIEAIFSVYYAEYKKASQAIAEAGGG